MRAKLRLLPETENFADLGSCHMTYNLENLYVAAVTNGFAIAVLAAVISWSQRSSVLSRSTLGLFFAAFAASEVDTVAAVLLLEMPQALRDGTELVGFVANFFVLPLFLFYVRELTAAPRTGIAGSGWHFALPGAALTFSCFAMTLPASTREAWYTGAAGMEGSAGLTVLTFGFNLLTLILVLQWLVYVIWIARTQAQHIARLKDHFASTEGLELQWVAVLACALGFYALQSLFGEALILGGLHDPIGPLVDSVLVLLIVVALALWGLRPSRDLEAATQTIGSVDASFVQKYEKSALGGEKAERIARKLLRAMREDRLYRDPNLTLGMLARHVGVSTNYVSQTLNQSLGVSFFEFVNSWRVKEAIPLVEAAEQTVLAIAYEVGFNSRSSFYASFKKETGLTPSAYKRAGAASPMTLDWREGHLEPVGSDW